MPISLALVLPSLHDDVPPLAIVDIPSQPLMSRSIPRLNSSPNVLFFFSLNLDFEPSLPPSPPRLHHMVTYSQNNIFKLKIILVTTKHSLSYALEPTSVTQALKHSTWRNAMSIEFDALVWNGIWELVPSNPTQNLVSCKWVFDIKRNLDGNIERYKAYFVTKGSPMPWNWLSWHL